MSGLADHDSPDVRGLWAAVCAAPEEDTPRLCLADALDECGDPDRAAFVRAQVECYRHPRASEVCLCGYEPRDGYHHNSPTCPYVVAAELLRAHEAAWRKAGKCLACGGRGFRWEEGRRETVRGDCPHCLGQGDRGGLCDALDPQDDRYHARDRLFHYRVDWSRGFPSAVHAPLQDVFVRVGWAHNAGGWVPTPRALAWVREWPVIERVHLTCRRPDVNGHVWGWFRHVNERHPLEVAPELVPAPVWQAIDGGAYRNAAWVAFDTEAEAVDALARAVVRVLRAALKPVPA